MSSAPSAAGQEFTLAREILDAAYSSADVRPIVVFFPSATDREELMRQVASERLAVGRQFADRVRDLDGVEDVIVTALEPDLLLAVIVRSLDLEQELRLQTVLIDVARGSSDPSIGDVVVLVAGEDERPPGESLLP